MGVDHTEHELNVVNFPWRAKSLNTYFATLTPNEQVLENDTRNAPVRTDTRQSSGHRVAFTSKPEEYARKSRTRRLQAGVTR
ncbi:hypothetical protein EMIT0P294_210007 [Pseudomonas sp. IT-P294]